MRGPYIFEFMPKLILSSSCELEDVFGLKVATIVDDPDVLRKTAGSKVVDMWGEIKPMKNASLIHLIAMGAHERTGPNRNGDSFKAAFLRENHPTFKTHGALYKDHLNKDYEKRYGDVEKTAFNDDMDRAELLVSARHDKCADWLDDIERGKRVDFSMGFDCEYDVCSICEKKSKTRKEYCEHVKKGAKAPFGMNRILEDGRKCYVDNPKGKFNDISKVGTGADMIAQHLRKVAGFEDPEAMSSAEMFELFGDKTATVAQSLKVAIAHKCSRMEKLVPMSNYRPDRGTVRISEKVANKLREASPSVMFAELAKIGAVLDFREFFKLAMGDRFHEIESTVDRAEPFVGRCFSDLADDSTRLARVCDNEHYDCAKTAGVLLNDFERAELIENFSIVPEYADQRAVKTALYGEPICPQESLVSRPAGPVTYLLDEYAAYKVAALEGTKWTLDDDVIRAAVMTS